MKTKFSRSVLFKIKRKLNILRGVKPPFCVDQDDFSGQVFHAPRYGILYFAIPKAGNTTLKWTMFDLIRPDLPSWVIKRVDESHASQPMVQDRVVFDYLKRNGFVLEKQDTMRLERKVAFSVVREPVDRVLSCWRDKIGPPGITNDRFEAGVHRGFLRYGNLFYGGMGLEEFCHAVAKIENCKANPHFRDQTDFLEMKDGRRLVDKVFKFDGMAETIPSFLKDFGVPKLELSKLNQSNYRGSKGICSDFLRKSMEKRYFRDYRAFGFKIYQDV